MGMPVLQRAQLLTKPAAKPQSVDVEPAAPAGPSIQSLDSFDINAPAPVPKPAPAEKPAPARTVRDTDPAAAAPAPTESTSPVRAKVPSSARVDAPTEAPAGNGGLWALLALIVAGAGFAAWYLLR
jgi:hypothetical protein